jgi:chromosome partitioning protein
VTGPAWPSSCCGATLSCTPAPVGRIAGYRASTDMKIVAITNIKGGVGKTTTAVNLAYLSAAAGARTLLWDLDAQGAATYTLQVEVGERVSAKKLVGGRRELPEAVVPSAYDRLHVLPADLSYRKFDLHLAARKRPTERLLKMSRALREAYDMLLLDCPPGMSLLTENVLRAADALVVPLLPTPLSLRMLAQLREFVAAEGWTDLRLLPFFSMVDRRRSLHRDLIGSTRAEFPDLLATEVPYWSEIERMSVRRAPMAVIAPHSAAARIYAMLWAEIGTRLGGAEPAAAPVPTGRDELAADPHWRLRNVGPAPASAPAPAPNDPDRSVH